MTMKVSDRGVLEIMELEGIVPAPYRDSKGIWTIYVGHTKNAGGIDPSVEPRGMPANMSAAIDKAMVTLRADLETYERRVNDALKVPVKQHEFDALVSFDMNTGGIYRAILTKEINKRNPLAYKHFMGWLKPPEITGRRKDEMNLFMTGDYDANGTLIPIWNVDNNGKLRGLHSHADGADLLRRMGRSGAASKSGSTIASLLIRLIRAIFGREK